MPHCRSCAAPLPAYSSKCEYCGTKNDIDLQGIKEYSIAQQESDRICPLCIIPMETVLLKELDHFELERCPKCMGLFFDPDELNALLDKSVKNVYTINLKKIWSMNQMKTGTSERKRMYIRCPVCKEMMNRVNFGSKSGVIIDKCKHGIWLDNGELRKLLEWRKAGGQLYHEKVMTERLREEEKKKKNNSPMVFNSAQDVFISHSRNETHNSTEIELDALFGTVVKTIWRLFSS